MSFLSNLLKNVIYNKLHAIEDKPKCLYKKHIISGNNSPFSGNNISPTYNNIVVDVLYVPEGEIITNNNNVITKQALFFYFNENELNSKGITKVELNDRFIFPYPINNITAEYKPIEITYIFGIWKVRIEKI